jgi:hypothetical protein
MFEVIGSVLISAGNPDLVSCTTFQPGEPKQEHMVSWYQEGEHKLDVPHNWDVKRTYLELESYGFCNSGIPAAEKAKEQFVKAVVTTTNPVGQYVAKQALTWVGVDFKPTQTKRCADWVRTVLDQIKVPVGVSKKAYGPLMADSFFDPDLGQIILDKSQLQEGDLIMYENTYDGGGSSPIPGKGKITHVGIYVGNGMMVDRPTAARPVQHRPIDTYSFHSALRPNSYGQ